MTDKLTPPEIKQLILIRRHEELKRHRAIAKANNQSEAQSLQPPAPPPRPVDAFDKPPPAESAEAATKREAARLRRKTSIEAGWAEGARSYRSVSAPSGNATNEPKDPWQRSHSDLPTPRKPK